LGTERKKGKRKKRSAQKIVHCAQIFVHMIVILRIEVSHLTGWGSAVRQCFAPGKENSHFNIASLGSALESGACGKHSGQGVKDSGEMLRNFRIQVFLNGEIKG